MLLSEIEKPHGVGSAAWSAVTWVALMVVLIPLAQRVNRILATFVVTFLVTLVAERWRKKRWPDFYAAIGPDGMRNRVLLQTVLMTGFIAVVDLIFDPTRYGVGIDL